MLYDKDLTVSNAARAVQLEQRVRAKVPNPFNAAALRAKAKEKNLNEDRTGLGITDPLASGQARPQV